MSTEKSKDLVKLEPINKTKLDKFLTLLSTPPKKTEVSTNPRANNAKYVAIGTVEGKLDKIFSGLWQTKNFNTRVVANEIVGEIDLGIFHPVAKIWLWRTGAGAVPIQQTKGSSVTDGLATKIKNTLTKDYPHLKAECIKNAAKSFGPTFGRDLNRKNDDLYVPITEEAEEMVKSASQEQIDACNSNEELFTLWKANPGWENNSLITSAYWKRVTELQREAK